jgi:predicted transcriptional regulator
MPQPAPRLFPDPSVETPSERDVRLEWEHARLAEADADFAAGRYLAGEAALEWLDRWAAGEDLEDPAVE